MIQKLLFRVFGFLQKLRFSNCLIHTISPDSTNSRHSGTAETLLPVSETGFMITQTVLHQFRNHYVRLRNLSAAIQVPFLHECTDSDTISPNSEVAAGAQTAPHSETTVSEQKRWDEDPEGGTKMSMHHWSSPLFRPSTKKGRTKMAWIDIKSLSRKTATTRERQEWS